MARRAGNGLHRDVLFVGDARISLVRVRRHADGTSREDCVRLVARSFLLDQPVVQSFMRLCQVPCGHELQQRAPLPLVERRRRFKVSMVYLRLA